MSSAVGARIETPRGRRGPEGRGRIPQEKNSILDLRMATLDAFLALFSTVHLFSLNAKKTVLLGSRILRPAEGAPLGIGYRCLGSKI